MSRRLIHIIIVCFLYGCVGLGQSSKNELLDQRDKILNEIVFTNKLIESTKKRKGNTVNSLQLIDRKIVNRTQLIKNYNAEIKVIEQKIIDREVTITKLSFDLEEQKKLYTDIIRYSYKNHNYYTKAVYLLASTSFNQFYMRKKYLEQLNQARTDKILLIASIQNRINYEISALNDSKIELGDALLKAKLENQELHKAKSSRQNILTSLSREEKSLKQDLIDKRKVEEEIGKRIEELIRAEAKKSAFAKLTPEQQLVSDDFERNQGRLPWPTRQGVITEKFGEHFHPVIKGIKVRNNGIDISTLQDSQVRTIFSGEVSKIFAIKGSNYTVIIRHGKFYTVYHNLENVQVNVGDQIKVKDSIGYVGRDNLNDNSILHFEIWKGLEKLNPEDWISD